ncbi:MAG: methyltransferase [Oscillospiraceae bacterium]|nr:methyltransferase [Oscillospiraceae bacterium]
MNIPAFDKKELEVVGEVASFGGPLPLYNFPIPMKDAYYAMLNREPVWQITGVETAIFTPSIIPDNVARALVFENKPFDKDACGGGKDMFGIDWEYVPLVGGSMVRPGHPFLDDANEWYDKVVWPDIDSWDWAGSAKENNGTYLTNEKYFSAWFQTGWYERLISFMDFEGAIMAMFDEDQQDAVKDLFDHLSDLYIKMIDKYIEYFPNVDSFYMHDDWGSQKETFFSPALCNEMIVPYMRKVTDYIHSRGKHCELHSCGQLMKQVPNMIEAGWDAWGGQLMNDTHKIYELYGDKILIGVVPDPYDVEKATVAEQRAEARKFVEKFCNPEKPCFINAYSGRNFTPAYREELYEQSRIRFGR